MAVKTILQNRFIQISNLPMNSRQIDLQFNDLTGLELEEVLAYIKAAYPFDKN